MRTIVVLLTTWLLLAFGGCGPSTKPAPVRSGMNFTGTREFAYETRDPEGAPITRGTLTLPWPLPVEGAFTGSWEARYVGPIKKDASPEEIQVARQSHGPQVGRGQLQGRFGGHQLVLQLNPQMRDNNVTFTVTVADGTLDGVWGWSTIAGLAKQGTVTAKAE